MTGHELHKTNPENACQRELCKTLIKLHDDDFKLVIMTSITNFHLPDLIAELVQQRSGIFRIFLRLLAHVEDRAILART